MGKNPDKKIIDFLKRVKRKYSIQKAVFFGSRARGDYFKKSDYDIILVSTDFEGVHFTKRTSLMYDFWKHYPLEIEAFCYTPKEFEIKSREHGMVRSALREGIEFK